MGAVASTLSIPSRALFACWLIVAGAAGPGDALAQAPNPPAPNGAATQAKPEPPRVTETPAVVIDGNAAQSLLGMPVQSLKGEDLGRVVDVVVDRGGGLRAAIVDFGGFLGVGTRKIAVDWRVLHFPDKGPMTKLVADLQRDQLRNAPAFKEGEAIVIIGAAHAAPAQPPAPPAAAPAPPSPAPAAPPAPKP